MTLAKGIYHRARKEIKNSKKKKKNSSHAPQLILKILGICVAPQILGWWDCLGIHGSPLVYFLWELTVLLVF